LTLYLTDMGYMAFSCRSYSCN